MVGSIGALGNSAAQAKAAYPTAGKACVVNPSYAVTGGNLEYDSSGSALYCVNGTLSYSQDEEFVPEPISKRVVECASVPTTKGFKTRACTTMIVFYDSRGRKLNDVKLGVTDYKITKNGAKASFHIYTSPVAGPCATKVSFVGYGEESVLFRLAGCGFDGSSFANCYIVDDAETDYCV